MVGIMRYCIIIFLIVTSHIFAGVVFSQTVNVTTRYDVNRGQCLPNDCSLREAIIFSNQNPGEDRIYLPAGTYLFQIPGAGESSANTGDLDVSDNIEIIGTNKDNTIIDGNSLDGVFEILPYVSVTMSDVTIKNGLRTAITGTGAGILNMGTLSLYNAIVSDNQSPNGGGISNSGTVLLTNVTVRNNSAIIHSGSLNTGYGGGVFNTSGGALYLDACTFASNHSQRNGGAVFNNVSAAVTVSSTLFTSNNSGAYGGAIATNGRLSATDSGFTLNTSDDGGAIANLEGGFLFLIRANFDQNSANGSNLGGGGAIFSYSGDSIISDSVFTDNISYGEGGGAINSTGRLSLSSSLLTGNRAFIHGAFDPQGLATSPGLGGGLYFITNSDVDIVDCTISNNIASTAGGAIYNDPGTTLDISSSDLKNNQVSSGGAATTWYGGAIHNGGDLTLNLSNIDQNSIVSGPSVGGGLCTFADGKINIYHSTISNNSADSGGGISHLGSDVLTVVGSTISANTAKGVDSDAFGGGIHTGGTLIIKNSTLYGNQSAHAGGAIAANGQPANVTLSSVTIAENTASTIASAVFNWQGKITTENTLFNGSCNNWGLLEGTFAGDENNNSPVDIGGNLESPGDTCEFTAASSNASYSGILTDNLSDNGGNTKNCLPELGSPLIDSGIETGVLVDQNNAPRNVDGNGDNIPSPDIGAVEYGSSAEGTTRNLIVFYYSSILARSPDQGGLDAWILELNRLTTLGISVQEGFILLAKIFLNSPEYLGFNKTHSEYIVDLYTTFFMRVPSPAELNYWTTRLTDGVTRNTVMNFFVFSPEFLDFIQRSFGLRTERPENGLVNDFYRGFLSRSPDDSGYLYWLNLIRSEQCKADSNAISALALQVANLFAFSQEYSNRNRSAENFIEDVYDGIMRRDGDPPGIRYWVNELLEGRQTQEQILYYFTIAEEFQLRVNNVIYAGCYPR